MNHDLDNPVFDIEAPYAVARVEVRAHLTSAQQQRFNSMCDKHGWTPHFVVRNVPLLLRLLDQIADIHPAVEEILAAWDKDAHRVPTHTEEGDGDDDS